MRSSSECFFSFLLFCPQAAADLDLSRPRSAITYELFPTPARGTGDGIAMASQRVFGLAPPIIAAYAGKDNPSTPVFVSASLFVAASIVMLFLPFEPRGLESM